MADLLTGALGSTSGGVTFFNGQWWILGLFFVVLILLYLNSKGVKSDYLLLIGFIGTSLMMVDGIFSVPEEYLFFFYIIGTALGAIAFYYFISKR